MKRPLCNNCELCVQTELVYAAESRDFEKTVSIGGDKSQNK